MYPLYHQCKKCNKYVWHTSLILGLCPYCAMLLPKFELEISFGRSTSKKYRTALKRIKCISSYIKEQNRHIVRFKDLNEYSLNRQKIKDLLLVIDTWVSCNILLNQEPIISDNLLSLNGEIDRMIALNNAKDIVFFEDSIIFIPNDNLNE